VGTKESVRIVGVGIVDASRPCADVCGLTLSYYCINDAIVVAGSCLPTYTRNLYMYAESSAKQNSFIPKRACFNGRY